MRGPGLLTRHETVTRRRWSRCSAIVMMMRSSGILSLSIKGDGPGAPRYNTLALTHSHSNDAHTHTHKHTHTHTHTHTNLMLSNSAIGFPFEEKVHGLLFSACYCHSQPLDGNTALCVFDDLQRIKMCHSLWRVHGRTYALSKILLRHCTKLSDT